MPTASPPAPERPDPSNVIAALARVMEELPGIGRNERSQQGYNYRGIEAITREASSLLGRYGVVFVPKVIDRKTIDLTVNGKPWTEDHATILYTVYGPGGIEDRIEVGPLVALGRDNSDKGMNKCMTQAFKYALLQTLCIGDSKDDADAGHAVEADAHGAPAAQQSKEQKLGWADADSCKAAHDAVAAQIKSLFSTIPEDAPMRKAIREHRDNNGWPMVPDALSALSMMVAKATPPAAQDGQEGAGGSESAPEAQTPAPEAPGTPWDASNPQGDCWYCEQPMVKGEATVIIGGQDADHPAQRMHASCREEQMADLEGDSAEDEGRPFA